MSAKEEHARNVDMHKMRRQYTEMTRQNAVLEAECANLKIATKDAFDKCSSMRETMTKQYTEKMNEMKTDFENEKKRLNEQAQKDASFQRAQHLESFNDIKRQLESFYAEKINENNAMHEAIMQQLKTERAAFDETRERTQRETEEQLAQLAQDRHKVNTELEEVRQQVNRELDGLTARIKRDEQEHIIRLVLELDHNREKMKCQLTEERKELVEQLEKEDIDKRQRTDTEIAEMKKQAEFEINEKMKKLEAEIQQLTDERDIVRKKEESLHELHQELVDELKKKEEEEISRHNDRLQELKNKEDDEVKRLKQKEEEQNERFSNEIKLINDERALMNKQFDEEREQIKRTQHEHNVQFLTQMNLERDKMKCQLETERQQIQNELSQKKRENDEQFNAILGQQRAAFDTTIQKLNDERDALKETDLRREKEHMVLMKQVQLEREANAKSNADALAQKNRDLDFKFNSAMQKLNDDRDELKGTDLRRKNEHLTQMKEMQLEREANAKSNADALMKAKLDMDSKFNSAMQKLNDERDELKRTDLRRKNEHMAILKEIQIEREANAKHNADALMKAKLEQESKFNLEIQKLNDDRDALKETDVRREKEHMVLMKQVQLEREANAKSNADALTKAMLEMDSKFNSAMQKLNDERDELKGTDLRRKNEHMALLKEIQIERDANAKSNAKSNADALNKSKLELDSKFNLEIQKLNDERDKLKETDLRREKDHADLMKKMQLEREARENSNADVLMKAKLEQESQFNLSMNKLNDERDKLKETDLRREKEHMFLMKQVQLEREARENSNADVLMKAKLDLDYKFNLEIQNLNNEREKLKETDLRREKDHVNLMKKMQLEREAREKHNDDVLMKTKLDLESKFNLAMQKLNDAQDELNETDLRREKEHMNLIKEIKLERMANAKHHADALLNAKLEQESKFNNKTHEMMEDWTQKNQHIETVMEQIRQEKTSLAKERATVEKEKMLAVEEKRLVEEKRIKLAKEQDEIKCEKQCQTGLIQSLMNEVEQLNIRRREEQEKHVQIQTQMKQCFETDNPTTKQLHDTVAANLAHLQLISSMDFKDKRVAIYSHYSSLDEVESYNALTIECIQHYFDYIIILTNCPNKWNMHSPNHNKIHLLNYNMKSDFRNYGVFIMQTELTLMTASCVCLINDSFVVVDVNAFGQCIKRVFELSHDFIGLTSSHENVFHMQSFFLHFNASTLKHVMNYFKEQGLPNNHDGAISKYELGISIYLINHGFSQFAFVSNDDMKFPLNTTCVKWSEVLNETGIIKRQHFFKRYAYKSMSDNDISEVAEKYSYNKHFINFLKYNNIKLITIV